MYARVVGATFAWDDWSLVVDAPAVHQLRPAPWFLHGFWARGHSAFYRPLVTLSFAIDWALSGGSPGWFHATNLVLHLFATGCVFALAYRVSTSAAAAAAAATLFGVAPRLTESVCWVSGRTDVLATLFALAGLWLHLARSSHLAGRVAAAALLFASLLSKETGLAGVAAVLVLEYVGARRTRDWRGAARRAAPALAATAVYLALRRRAFAVAPQMLNPSATDAPWTRHVAAALQSTGRYTVMLLDALRPRLLIGAPGEVETVFMVVAAVVLMAVTAALIAARHRPWRASTAAVVTMGAAGIAPVLDTTFLRLPAAASDRFLYLPIACLTIVAAALASRAGHRARRSMAMMAACTALIFCVRSHARVGDWTDEVRLWEVTASERPESGVAEHELGLALQRAGAFDDAAEHFGRAADRVSGTQRIASLKNRATALADAGHLDEAVEQLRSAMTSAPPTALDHYNLGIFELRRIAFDRSEQELRCALDIAPDLQSARDALAQIPTLRAAWGRLPVASDAEPASVSADRARILEAIGARGRARAEWHRVVAASDAEIPDLIGAVRALATVGELRTARLALARAHSLGLAQDVEQSVDSALTVLETRGDARAPSPL